MTGLIIAIFIISALSVLISMKKSGHFIKALLLTAVEGTAALLAVNALSAVTGVCLPLNALTLGSGAIFGTPGIIMNLITQIILA